jgi:hypothetical protein
VTGGELPWDFTAGQRLAKSGWTLPSVDSQELTAEDGRGTTSV